MLPTVARPSTLLPTTKIHWTRWYKKKRWRKMRAHQLMKQPLCVLCLRDGKPIPATIVDHVERHFGDPQKFWFGSLQSVCRDCHEIRKKFIEARGYARDIGADGWPLDPMHPANLPRKMVRRFGFGIPHNLQPSAVPVTLVCGPPAAGKSTFVDAQRKPGDTVIDLDECKLRVGGRPWDTDRAILRRGLAYRDAILRSLHTQSQGHAFVVVGAPTRAERTAWCEALGIPSTRVVLLAVSAGECIDRIAADHHREHAKRELILAVQRWHHLHARDRGP